MQNQTLLRILNSKSVEKWKTKYEKPWKPRPEERVNLFKSSSEKKVKKQSMNVDPSKRFYKNGSMERTAKTEI